MDGHAGDGLRFVKMHGAGNDFVVIDRRAGGAPVTASLARALADRHRGVGFDQLAEVSASPGADFALTFRNPDGSTADACGNATRCVAWREMAAKGTTRLRIRTARGMLVAERREGAVWVNMGPPVLRWQDVPLAREVDLDHLPLPGAPAAVGMGNPHVVFFRGTDADPAVEGPAIESHPLFPQRTNVHFARPAGPDRLRVRVWERGTGVTLACGSGACAVAVAAARRGLTGRRVALEMDGGMLTADWREDGVWLTGPVATVFEGRLAPGFPEAVA